MIAQRKAVALWWTWVKSERCEEVAMDFLFRLRMRKIIKRWHEDAKFEAHHKRQNALVMENQRQFNLKMKLAEDHARELVEIEKKKQLQRELEEEARREQEKIEARERAQARVRQIKKEDQRYILNIQRDARKRRVEKQLQGLKKRWKEYWMTRSDQVIEQARERAQEYLESDESEYVMAMRFAKLKREFFAPPAPENKAREEIITNSRNICMLYMEAKLKQEGKLLRQVMPLFDDGNKGYLSYNEFKKMVKSLGVQLSPIQVNEVIRGVDQDGDGFIELPELEAAMAATEKMGEPGSVWRLYVDPATDVICYHNFETGQKVFEQHMTDDILKDVNVANYYGESLMKAKDRVVKLKEEDWIKRERHYYTKRIQYMYRLWKGRKERLEHAWKVDTNIARENRVFQRVVIEFIERLHHANRVRAIFKKQYLKTIEKIWDPSERRMFWYNHQTHVSSWEEPHLVRRYGDAEMPAPWVVHTGPEWVELPKASPDAEQEYATQEMTSYWHATSGVQLKRKPDGVYLCQICNHNIALRHCHECAVGHCFTCYRDRHSHPWGFMQVVKVTKKMKLDPVYTAGCDMAAHTWKRIDPIRCDMCHSKNKMMAAIDCKKCDKKLCRPCSRRIHDHLEGDAVHVFTIF